MLRYSVCLIFVGEPPDWVRVYEPSASGGAKLLKDLRPSHENRGFSEYLDIAEDVEAQSARIYVFSRAAGPARGAMPDL